MSTPSSFLRTASSAASFRRFARSAPEKPGVPRATRVRSASSANFIFAPWSRRISSRPLSVGSSTTTCRSKRPGLRSAASSVSGRFVAAITMTPSLASKPSISTSMVFSVCSYAWLPPIAPAPVRFWPMESISSMKTMHGARFFASPKTSRMRLAPTPTNISSKSLPLIAKKGTPASPAMALASSVLPVPGGPTRSMPFGMRPPSRLNAPGSFRNSTISCTSSRASSMPATSAKVTFLPLSSLPVRTLAFDLPKLNIPPPPTRR